MAYERMIEELKGDEDLVSLASRYLNIIHNQAVPLLQAELEKKNIILTEDLKKSLATKLIQDFDKKAVEFVLSMDLHGQMVDYKTTKYLGRPPVDEFIKGVEKALQKGTLSITHVPGYKYGTMPASKEATIKRVASAIVVSYQKRVTITRPAQRRNWLNVYFKNTIAKMTDELTDLSTAYAVNEAEIHIKNLLSLHTT